MGIADAFATHGGDDAPWGIVLYAISAVRACGAVPDGDAKAEKERVAGVGARPLTASPGGRCGLAVPISPVEEFIPVSDSSDIVADVPNVRTELGEGSGAMTRSGVAGSLGG